MCINPVIDSDFVDAQTVTVNDSFYLFSSSDYSNNGIPYISSHDLVHWRYAGWIDDKEFSNGSMRCVSAVENNGIVYVLFYSISNDRNILYFTNDITRKSWQSLALDTSYNEGSLFFEDGSIYFISTKDNSIIIQELNNDFNSHNNHSTPIITASPNKTISHPKMYHINDWHYILLTEEDDNGYSKQLCGRSMDTFGHYEFRVILDGGIGLHVHGISRASLLETSRGDWYAMLNSRGGAFIDVSMLQPVTWKDGWPIMGDNTTPVESFNVNLKPTHDEDLLFAEEDFSADILSDAWQVLKTSDTTNWSLTDHQGWLRLYSNKKANSIANAECILMHRVNGPMCYALSNMDVSGMKPGQIAGLASFNGKRAALVCVRMNRKGQKKFLWQEYVDGKMNEIYEVPRLITENVIPIGVGIFKDYRVSCGRFKFHPYSEWINFVEYHDLKKDYETDLIGVRMALFTYTIGDTGGYVDFNDIRIEQTDIKNYI